MRFYTGCYTRMGGPGVGVCSLDNGELSLIGTYHDVDEPTYVILSHDKRTLYAVGNTQDTAEGALASYRADGSALHLLSIRKTAGRAGCHIAESADGRFVYTANYLSGSVSVFPAENGVLGERIQLIEHTGHGANKARQESAHIHQCVFRPGTNQLFVNDLGTDEVWVYNQNVETGMLQYEERIKMPDGMGPRHLVFANDNLFYVTGELDNMVRRVENKNGWQITGEISTLPENFAGENTSAAIKLYGGALYVSNRGHDSLCKIQLDEMGNMVSAGWMETGGSLPRDFAIVDGTIIFANQGGCIATSDGKKMEMGGAVCICPMEGE